MICPSCREDSPDDSEHCFRCGAPFPTVVRRSDVVGGRYEIRDRLGRGGMGVVYRAHDLVLGEDIALKLLRPDVGQSEELLRRFRSEIKLARKITHPNVCRIHDYGEAEGRQFISMELVEGVDLRRWMREHAPLGRDEAFDIALQLASGLEAVHAMGVVHRDLKPQNAMRDSTGRIRLMDFGIAKPAKGDATTGGTAEGAIIGTPEYMSPEQARGLETDFRSDVYSMGILTFELFTGRAPFIGSTPVATLLQQVDAEPPLDQPVADPIPFGLRPVLAQALAKDPGKRFANAASLRAALELARQASLGEPTTGQPVKDAAATGALDSVPTATMASTTPGTRARAWWGFAAAALVIGMLAVAWMIRHQPVEPLPVPNTVRPSAATISPSREATAPSQAMNDDEEAIRQVLGAYAWALRTRDVTAFEKLKPSMTASELERLKWALKQKAIASMKVSMTIDSIRVEGDHATAVLTRHDTINGRPMRPIGQWMRLSRNGDSWRIESMGPSDEGSGQAAPESGPAKP